MSLPKVFDVLYMLYAYFTVFKKVLAYIKHSKQILGDTMNGENLKAILNQAVEDYQFYVEYRNSLTPEELAVSTIDFKELGIL